MSSEGVVGNHGLLAIINDLIGKEVVLVTSDGIEHKGIFAACSPKDLDVGLSLSFDRTESNMYNLLAKKSEVLEKEQFCIKDIVSISALINEDKIIRGFTTDKQYHNKANGENEDELEVWECEEGDDADGIEHHAHGAHMRNSRNAAVKGWSVDDMFKVNQQMGVTTTFQDDLTQYTTVEVEGTDEDRRRAEEIAKAIERDATSKHYAKLENDDDERDLDKVTNEDDFELADRRGGRGGGTMRGGRSGGSMGGGSGPRRSEMPSRHGNDRRSNGPLQRNYQQTYSTPQGSQNKPGQYIPGNGPRERRQDENQNEWSKERPAVKVFENSNLKGQQNQKVFLEQRTSRESSVSGKASAGGGSGGPGGGAGGGSGAQRRLEDLNRFGKDFHNNFRGGSRTQNDDTTPPTSTALPQQNKSSEGHDSPVRAPQPQGSAWNRGPPQGLVQASSTSSPQAPASTPRMSPPHTSAPQPDPQTPHPTQQQQQQQSSPPPAPAPQQQQQAAQPVVPQQQQQQQQAAPPQPAIPHPSPTTHQVSEAQAVTSAPVSTPIAEPTQNSVPQPQSQEQQDFTSVQQEAQPPAGEDDKESDDKDDNDKKKFSFNPNAPAFTPRPKDSPTPVVSQPPVVAQIPQQPMPMPPQQIGQMGGMAPMAGAQMITTQAMAVPGTPMGMVASQGPMVMANTAPWQQQGTAQQYQYSMMVLPPQPQMRPPQGTGFVSQQQNAQRRPGGAMVVPQQWAGQVVMGQPGAISSSYYQHQYQPVSMAQMTAVSQVPTGVQYAQQQRYPQQAYVSMMQPGGPGQQRFPTPQTPHGGASATNSQPPTPGPQPVQSPAQTASRTQSPPTGSGMGGMPPQGHHQAPPPQSQYMAAPPMGPVPHPPPPSAQFYASYPMYPQMVYSAPMHVQAGMHDHQGGHVENMMSAGSMGQFAAPDGSMQQYNQQQAHYQQQQQQQQQHGGGPQYYGGPGGGGQMSRQNSLPHQQQGGPGSQQQYPPPPANPQPTQPPPGMQAQQGGPPPQQ